MSPSNVLAGVFLFLLGAAAMGAYAYRTEIRALLGLANDETANAVADLASSAKALYAQFTGKKAF